MVTYLAPSGAHENGERLRWKEGAGFPAPIMVDVRRRKLAIIAMNVSVLAAALSWLLVLFSALYSATAVPWALGVAIVLTVIGAYALYRYYSKYSHVLPNEDPDAHDVLGHDLHSTHLPHLHHTERTSDGA
ncbi:N-acyl-D-glutamate deacylase [Rothia sp. HMSC066H02]|nr:N-acyl-D-glutamate deacylase [Rothia sp. HMSC065D09]OFP11307.1 N-acyl-D-glutamate deacylase [Rothia sp. HMSC066H02]